MAFKSLPMVSLDDDFYARKSFYLLKSFVGLHVNAKTKLHEQSPRGTEVLFKAKHVPKSQQICMFAKTMNFPVEQMGNEGQNLPSAQQFLPKPV